MSLKRTRGAVYDLNYHVVRVPKYRREVIRRYIKHQHDLKQLELNF